jgi:hypothetical protein
MIGLAAVEIEHHVGDPLPGAVVGELPAAPDVVHWKSRLDQFLRSGAGACGVER